MILSKTRDAKRHTGNRLEKTLSRDKRVSKIAKIMTVAIGAVFLNGCLMTSPYWNQSFSSHTAEVPLQAWTTNKNYLVKYECATASHGGLYPPFGRSIEWTEIDTVMPSQQSVKDSYGTKVFTAGIKRVLPTSCWRQDPANSTWYSAVRATQTTNTSTTTYKNFNKIGIECLGMEVGKATSWFGWFNKDCVFNYSGSSTAVPYVIVLASS